jgi:hypothetical protein
MNIATAAAALALVLIHPWVSFGQNPDPPLLSITYQGQPQIAVYGLQGTNYQVQYTTNLSPADWQVLTNFMLGTSPYTVVDPAAPATGMRLYRALRQETGGGSSYAPTNLVPAEVFRFTWQSAEMTITDTLVLNSLTNGVLMRQGYGPADGMSLVEVAYHQVGPFLAEMAVIYPPSGAFPMGQTNLYTLAFTGPAAGYFELTEGSIAYVGGFVLDPSFVGQQLAPSQPTPGEIYSLLTTNAGISNLTTLVINSPTSGVLRTQEPVPPGSMNLVSIEYTLLGPLSCQFEVVSQTNSAMPFPQTNLYLLVYAAANAGLCQSSSEPVIYRSGEFERDTSLLGQQLAPAQLTAGEIYSLLTTNAGISNLTMLVINSPTSGVLMTEELAPAGGMNLVSIQYALLGPLSCQLEVVGPTNNMMPIPWTNLYYLVYTSTNSGPYQSVSGAAMYSLGEFVRDPSLVGQQLASSHLIAGEIYSLLETNYAISNLATLVINSPTNGVLMTEGPAPIGGINPVSIQYSLLGPLSCQLVVTIPTNSTILIPQTNLYWLVYTSTNAGPYQSVSGAAIYGLGWFERDRSLVGQQPAPIQLTAGESYYMISSNGPAVTEEVLIINSPTDGILIHQGGDPEDGIFPDVALEYLALGPLTAQIQAVIPQPMPPPSYRTNTYLLVYTAQDAGQVRRTAEPAIVLLGQFLRSPPQ